MIACSINVQDPPTASVPIGKGFNGLSSREKNLRLTWNTSFNIIKICNANKFNERTDLGWKLICGYLRWHASLTYEILPTASVPIGRGLKMLGSSFKSLFGKKSDLLGRKPVTMAYYRIPYKRRNNYRSLSYSRFLCVKIDSGFTLISSGILNGSKSWSIYTQTQI